jgi:hypothetical protein
MRSDDGTAVYVGALTKVILLVTKPLTMLADLCRILKQRSERKAGFARSIMLFSDIHETCLA